MRTVTSSKFWIGVGAAVGGFYAWRWMRARSGAAGK